MYDETKLFRFERVPVVPRAKGKKKLPTPTPMDENDLLYRFAEQVP